MAPQTLTRGRLRRLADVHPDRGRVLSVFMNLDPSEFATPSARSSQITSVLTEAARRIEEAGDLEQDERAALKADVERVREVLSGDIAGNGTRALAVFACQPADLLEVVPLREPLESRVVLDDSPYVEPLVYAGQTERWCVLLCNRRVARLFTGPGDELEETDRIVDDVHRRHEKGGWSQANYQRSVEKEVEDHIAHTAEVAFALSKRRGFDRLLVGAPDELVGDLEAKLHPYLKERLAGRISCDVENSGVDAVRACAGEKILEHARGREREQLDRLAQGVGSGDRGAAGLSQVLAAINEARVEVLLVARGLSAAGFCDPAHRAAVRDARGGARRRDRDAGDRRRREGDREGDRAVGRGAGHPPPRRPRAARRHRGRPALLAPSRDGHGPRARRRRLPERLRVAGRRAVGVRRRRDRRAHQRADALGRLRPRRRHARLAPGRPRLLHRAGRHLARALRAGLRGRPAAPRASTPPRST